MQTIVTDDPGICLSACQSVCLSVCHAGSFGAAFAKLLWPFVYFWVPENIFVTHIFVSTFFHFFSLNSQNVLLGVTYFYFKLDVILLYLPFLLSTIVLKSFASSVTKTAVLAYREDRYSVVRE